MPYDCVKDSGNIPCSKAHLSLKLDDPYKHSSTAETTGHNMPNMVPREQFVKSDSDNGISQFNKILIVGLGQLGLPVAKYVKERGFETFGYDINPKEY